MKNNTYFKSALLVMTLAGSMLSIPVLALDGGSDFNQLVYTKVFKALDTDSSLSLSKVEVQKDKPLLNHFNNADKNNDDSLDKQEYIDFKIKR